MKKSNSGLFRAGLVILLCVGITISTNAQFNLVSITPSDGTTEVSDTLDVVFTFNKPVDMTYTFDTHDGFFMALYLSNPEIFGDPDSVEANGDFTQITFYGVTLPPNTQFTIGIMDARSTDGNLLEYPTFTTFSTGASLGVGSASGTISYPAGDPKRAIVEVRTGPVFGRGEIVGTASVTSSAGSYTINYIPSGDYHVIAMKDADRNGNPDSFESGDPFGLYESDGDKIADMLSFSGSTSYSSIDIEIAIPAYVLAKSLLPDASSYAKSIYADSYLGSIHSFRNNTNGEGQFWIYQFYSPGSEEFSQLLCTDALIAPIEEVMFPPEFSIVEIDSAFINSDTAIDSANANGGSEFLLSHTDIDIMMSLASIDFSDPPPLHKSIPNIPSETPVTLWIIEYEDYSTGEGLDLFIDAYTGAMFDPELPPMAVPTTARPNLEIADSAALLWAVDSELFMVGSTEKGVDFKGETEQWAFMYHSEERDTNHAFLLSGGKVVDEKDLNRSPLPSTEAISDEWIDSDAAIAVADMSGGGLDFRTDHGDSHIEANLFMSDEMGTDLIPVWKFLYSSPTSEDSLKVTINAVDGSLVTGINDGYTSSIPYKFGLKQNFPNPFNPATTIEYEIDNSKSGAAVPVSIKVFDILGREIVTLIDEMKYPGKYSIRFNSNESGRQLSSGTYFYTLKASNKIKTRKMILVK